ncbi:genetic suppressor element 1 isoform X2 [Hyla sarda]|uniref:genetic suppressor element 1 isoform X2 n=1 Tax=Hyla sarda TaxID=327740 RepID=UPI0024C39742|nr:genetic suppressor element 1 isoform X2 [Hyla sarda]
MTDAPRSRKQRLMAAVEEEEAAAAPGAGEGVLYCFICGGGVPRGREVRLPVRCPAREGCAFFPFLQQQEPAPGAEPLSPGGSARVCAVCQRFLGAQWDAFERSRTPLEKRMYWLKRPYQCGGDGARAHPRDWNPNYDSELSDLSDNPLSDPEESSEPPRRQWAPPPRAPGLSAPCRASPSDRVVKGAEIEGERRPENGLPVTCYICGAPGAGNVLHVQKQEHSPQAPFFPFLWLHTPPPGANPLTPGGSARACDSCFSSLMQQWHSFDMANVPVLQRLYVVPLHASPGAEKGISSRLNDSQPKGPGVCYLCGEDCANQGKPVRSRITNGNAKSTMHFPFITQLPCPPGSKGLSHQGEVQSCRKCYGVLEDIWAIYRASQNEELICSVQSFLSRYHQVFSSADASPPGSTPNRRAGVLSAHSAPTSVCYVCGEELGPGCEYQLSINPPNRYADKEPFFPFLTVYPPAPRARPADSTGLVSTCGLCYHDLLGQWFQHEMKTQHPSSPWSRQYQVETFVCFFCRQEKRRLLGLRNIQLARLPVFLLARRVPHSLFVDDGKQLLIGACTECKPLAMVNVNMAAHSGPLATSSPATGQTYSAASRFPGVNSTASKVPELEHNPKTGKDPPAQPPSQESCLDVERAEPGTTRSSISSESSPVSSPATNHSSPASTPKRGPMGPIIVPPAGHSVPNTPPVVTIAPTKTVNGVWRSEARQQPDNASRANSISRERLMAESQLPSEKAGTQAVPSHLLGSTYAFAIPPSSVVQDSRFQPLNLQRPVHHVVPPSTVTEEYLRSFRPYHTAEDLRMPSLPHIGLDPNAAAAYYHNSYLAHHTFTHPAFRMDDSYCLSALRSPFYPLHSPGSLPPLHPSAMHLHLSGVRYPTDLAHSSLSALQSERITAERLQMDEELRQREREREREREKEREADREREKEREREREREREKKEMEREKERERERELERQRERTREKDASLIKNIESQYLAETEVHPLRMHQEERVKQAEQPAPTRPDKVKEPSVQTPKPVQHQMHQPPTSHHSVPSLISSHTVFPPTSSSAAAALLAQRTQEEEKWLARQRRLRQEKEDRQYQVSEFRQQVLEQQLDITGRPIGQQEAEIRPENLTRVLPTRNEGNIREPLQHFGGPPPLISPKTQQHSVPTSLWNPVSLMDTPSESRRSQEPASIHNHTATIYEHSRHMLPPVKVERPYSFEKQQLEEEDLPRRKEQAEKYQPIREHSLEHTSYSHAPFLAELEKSTQSLINQQRSSLQQAGHTTETTFLHRPSLSHRTPPTRTRDPMYIYDEFLQQHRRLVSKLDLEERRRKEAREKGYYYDLDDSYDESDEEEVRAHLRRVAEQPPLKLDTSSEKLEFLQIFGLATQQEKELILQQKRRKRRRMLRERSQSPPIQSKRQTPSPHSPLSTRFSPDELNNSPNLEEKKKFLTFFDLSHVSTEQRRDKEKLVEMLEAIKQKNSVPEAAKNPPLATCRGSSPLPTGAPSEDQTVLQPSLQTEVSTPVPSTSCSVTAQEPVKPPELVRPEPPKLLDRVTPLPVPVTTSSTNVVSTEKVRQNETLAAPAKKSLSILNFVRGHPAKENPVQTSQSVNGRSKSWEPFIAEEFAHQFHESVLQSTQKALQKHKGSSTLNCAEQNHKPDASVHYNIPELQQSSRPTAPHQNGQQGPVQSGMLRGTPHPDVSSGEETSDEDYEEDDIHEPPRLKWQGIEAIFESYQEHIEEQNLERQVLETQCKRLEAQHYNLSLTAEQISHRMADLMSQKQKVASERERLQAELEHFRKCLVLPPSPWSRGYFKGHPR